MLYCTVTQEDYLMFITVIVINSINGINISNESKFETSNVKCEIICDKSHRRLFSLYTIANSNYNECNNVKHRNNTSTNVIYFLF